MSLMYDIWYPQKSEASEHYITFISKAKKGTENLRSAYLAKLHYNLFNFVISFFGFHRLKRQRFEFEEGKNLVSAW